MMSVSKCWITRYVPLYIVPSLGSARYCDLPAGTVVMRMDGHEQVGGGLVWCETEYTTNTTIYRGWVIAEYVETFVEPKASSIIKIKGATRSQSDLAQYLIYLGHVQYNLCGEFCVLFCAGWSEMTIEDWIEDWKIKSPSIFNRIFYGGKSRTTGIGDLTNMLTSFDGYPEKFSTIADFFTFRGSLLFTPGRVEQALKNNQIIIGVKMDRQHGRLRGSGVPHWVVLESIHPIARGGEVCLYNPASNAIETYNWEELIASTAPAPYGIVIPRERQQA